jgi:hypothetical protein
VVDFILFFEITSGGHPMFLFLMWEKEHHDAMGFLIN